MAAGGDDVFERAVEIGDFVERTVKGDFHRRGELYKRAGAVFVDGRVEVQDADDDTRSSKTLRVLQLGANGGEVGCRVDETFGMRAQQYVYWQAAVVYCLFDQRVAGGESADIEPGAELDAVRSTWPGRQGGFKSFCAKFEDDRLAQDKWKRMDRSFIPVTLPKNK